MTIQVVAAAPLDVDVDDALDDFLDETSTGFTS